MASALEVTRGDGVVVATLNRPDKLNALNREIFTELERLIDVLETDKTARVLILTGSGEKAFCVGADLKERQGMNEKDILLRLEYIRRLYPRLEALSVPVIGAINGLALGGGTELALACDLRIASENAAFALPETKLAIIPGTGGTQRLPRVIGMTKAMEMILLGKRLLAKEALEVGLVNAVVPSSELLATARSWASEMLEAGPIALRQAKCAVRIGIEQSLSDGLQTEIRAYKACLYSKDRIEGLKAFAEKRPAEFKGE